MCDIEKKMLPIGVENFEEIRTDGYYYVDKTGMIRDLLNRRGKVTLFTRPRRFGKSLNMSMLQYFFEYGCDKSLFEGLDILNEISICERHMGKYPVVSVSLKSVNGSGYETARSLMCSVIGEEALRFYNLLDSKKLNAQEKELYRQLVHVDMTGKTTFDMPDAVLMGSLKTLSALLRKHYGKKVIVLIDEYDVPLAKASNQGYYDQMIFLMRNMFEAVLKTNDSLQFAVLTGCMRVSKESIFTGLNNLRVLSVTDMDFEGFFGFTDNEVRELLEYYNLSDHYEKVKEWYDGYQFGSVGVYCPWDVISYCMDLRTNPEAQPQNYWSNTSSNDAVKRFIQKADGGTVKRDIEKLVAGEIITREIHQELTYKDMYNSADHIWSVLFMTGYLTQRGQPEGVKIRLVIPNMEIRNIFTAQIMAYFKDSVEKDGETLNCFCEALKSGDEKGVEKWFEGYLKKTISIRDTFIRKKLKENFYHGILLGILGFKHDWIISSSKEAGDRYSDILVEIDEEVTGIIIEVKYAEDGELEKGCRNALKQIQEKRYEEIFHDEDIEHILRYGIACHKKRCMVMLDKSGTERGNTK